MLGEVKPVKAIGHIVTLPWTTKLTIVIDYNSKPGAQPSRF
jgi:hypothetical protein